MDPLLQRRRSFDATVTSGDDHDSWIIRRVALKDGNGAILAFRTHSGP